jgi:transcription elongation factor Elf1
MNELVKTQECPFCGNAVDDSQAEWEDGTHEVTCDSCGKEYSVETEYEFLGWKIEKICTGCGSTESECFCEESEVGEEAQ